MSSLELHLTGLSQAVDAMESKSVCVGSKPTKDQIAKWLSESKSVSLGMCKFKTCQW